MTQVPTVTVDHLVCVVRKDSEYRAGGLSPDSLVSIVAALHDKCEPKEMIAISHRLTALANLVVAGDADVWTIHVAGEDYTLVRNALVWTAALAPLQETEMTRDLRFGREILDMALQIVEPDGLA